MQKKNENKKLEIIEQIRKMRRATDLHESKQVGNKLFNKISYTMVIINHMSRTKGEIIIPKHIFCEDNRSQ